MTRMYVRTYLAAMEPHNSAQGTTMAMAMPLHRYYSPPGTRLEMARW